MPSSIKHNRLPRNFHKTFKPERQYINAMLQFAASGREGDYKTIAASTGIPTGSSSGKVPAILDYCRGMGLVELLGPKRSAIKKPVLTPFGRAVFLDDCFLKDGVSQWIAHLNLSRTSYGADVWYHTFFSGTQSLGMSYERTQLELYLRSVYATAKGDLIGPMIRMYEDEAAFRMCGVLSESSGVITRKPAPVSAEYVYGYGAWLLQLISDHFPGRGQVSTIELDASAGWSIIPGWDFSSKTRMLELVQGKSLLEVDRHMEPWLLRPKACPEKAWNRIYQDLL